MNKVYKGHMASSQKWSLVS